MVGTSRSDWMHQWFRNELRNFFEDAAWNVDSPRTRTTTQSGVFPSVNIYDDGESFMVRAELPGVKADELDISAKGDQLVIRGERTVETPAPEANLHRREREGGKFRRALTLPREIDPNQVQARLSHGVLEVFAPRTPEQKPRKVQIEA